MIKKALCIGKIQHLLLYETPEEYTQRQLGFTPKWLHVRIAA